MFQFFPPKNRKKNNTYLANELLWKHLKQYLAHKKPSINGSFYYYNIIKLLQSYNKNTLTCQNRASTVFQCPPDSGSLELCRSFLWCGQSNEATGINARCPIRRAWLQKKSQQPNQSLKTNYVSVLEELTTISLHPENKNFVLFIFYSQHLAHHLMDSRHPVFVDERLNQLMG